MKLSLALLIAPLAFAAPPDGIAFTPSGQLAFPASYREWVFLSSGLGMTYGPSAPSEPSFDNVFVNPTAYRAFLATGRWPSGSLFVLEVRRAQSQGSINRGGHFQSTSIAWEVHLKDASHLNPKQFPGGWAFFEFPSGSGAASPVPPTASCYSCHSAHGAVDSTFVQFYPTLIEPAKKQGVFHPDAP